MELETPCYHPAASCLAQAPFVPGGATRGEADSDRRKENGNVNEYEILLLLDPELDDTRQGEVVARAPAFEDGFKIGLRPQPAQFVRLVKQRRHDEAVGRTVPKLPRDPPAESRHHPQHRQPGRHAVVHARIEKARVAAKNLIRSFAAEQHRRLGQDSEARNAYEQALSLVQQEPERRFLERRLTALR